MAAEIPDTNTEEVHGWGAADYEAALARLETLQEQLDALRSTIPSLVAPLMQPAASKAQMFANIKKAALRSMDEIKTFRNDWSSEQTQQLFARSKESLEKNTDLKRANEVAKYGWTEG